MLFSKLADKFKNGHITSMKKEDIKNNCTFDQGNHQYCNTNNLDFKDILKKVVRTTEQSKNSHLKALKFKNGVIELAHLP